MSDVHIETKHLLENLEKLDEPDFLRHISNAEYMQIGLLLKILETLNNIQLKMRATE